MASFIEDVKKLRRKVDELYIYGMGMYGNNIYKYLMRQKIKVDGFVVTKKNSMQSGDIPVYETTEVIRQNVGIILGLSTWNKEDVLDYLDKLGFSRDKVLDGGQFLDKGGGRSGHDNEPVLEITTRVGCKIDCKYCPQSLFLEKYYQNNPNRTTVMSIETFQRCLDKMPESTNLVFSGMAEPLLNPDCIKMIRIGCEMGKKVDLFTTLVGANIEMAHELSRLPLNRLILHIADRKEYAKIPISEDYYQMVEYLINAKKEDGYTPVVSICNAQTEPDERIMKICEGKYEIMTAMLDRAGNLQGSELLTKKQDKGSLSCTLCGTRVNRNVLLPDGTFLLCCMDFGMKHILGNLLEQTYEEIVNGAEVMRIQAGLNGDESQDILCRSCTNATKLC